MTVELRHRKKPCDNCPWRRDAPAGEFSDERYAVLRETAGAAGREAPIGAPIFACHKTPEGREIACAGWLATVGYEHLGIRLAIVMGRLPGDALAAGDDWPELYSSYDEMVAAQHPEGAACQNQHQ